MAKITVRLSGGLGNQMFQYAAGYALAARTGARLQLDATALVSAQRPYHLDVFGITDPVARASYATFLLRRLRRRIGWPEPSLYREPHYEYDPAFEALAAPVTIEGYFQSWRYGAAQEAELRRLFRQRRAPTPAASANAALIDAAAIPVSVHVRRGDYLSPAARSVHGVLGSDYYDAALRLAADRLGPGASYFVFSDEPERARSELSLPAGAVLVRGSQERPWEDLHLMARCRHHIIANSSFSWWGAWLNPSEKLVVAPRQWFTPQASADRSTLDLIPADWVTI